MKKIIYILVVFVILLVAVFYYIKIDNKRSQDSLNNQFTKYSGTDVGIEFDYRSGPKGYVVDERMPVDLGGDLVEVIILQRAEDLKNEPPVAGEGSPVITISIFNNSKKQFPQNWADKNIQYSNINLKTGDVSEAVVGGANAINYMADGLYTSENFVVAHGDNIYVITGQFMDKDSDLRRDFKSIVDSIKFIPTANQVSGKINIDAVCEGALSYMSFPDGASADKFVKDCKEGNHPEVIEKYKADMGLGDGASI